MGQPNSYIVLLFIAIFMAMMNTSCKPTPEESRLSEAEYIMEEKPDSALFIISGINPAALSSAGSRAKYNLLLTQAEVKNDVPIASDSLISQSVGYYAHTKMSADYMKSLFYQAQVRYYLGLYDKSIVPAMKSREIAIAHNDHYWQAKAAELIGYIYAECYLRENAIVYTREAVEQYELAGMDRNKLFALCCLAVSYYNKSKDTSDKGNLSTDIMVNKGLELLDSVCSIANTNPVDSILVAYILETKLHIYIEIGNLTHAAATADSIATIDLSYYSAPATLLSNLAYIKTENNNFEEAAELLEQASAYSASISDKASVLCNYTNLYKKKKNFPKAYETLDSVLALQNTTVYGILQQPVIAALQEKSEMDYIEEKDRYSSLITFITISAILIAIIAIAITFHLRLRFKLRKSEEEQQSEKIISLSDDLKKLQILISEAEQEKSRLINSAEEKKSIVRENELLKESVTTKNLLLDEMRKKEEYAEKMREKERILEDIKEKEWRENSARLSESLDIITTEKGLLEKRASELEALSKSNMQDNQDFLDIFMKRWQIIGNLCNEYISVDSELLITAKIPKTLKLEIENLRQPDEQKRLVMFLDKFMNNIISLLREEGDFIQSDEDEFLYSLFFLKFSPKTICLLTRIKFKTIFTRKYRLKDKIKASNATHKDFFLSKLE